MTLDKIVNSADKSKYAALALASAQVANGSLILQYEPVMGSTAGLAIELTNNDQGAIYDSATLTLLSPLAQALYALPANQLGYATIQDMVADWNVNIQSTGSGNVYSGWNRTVNGDGSVDLGHNPGFPDFDYTQWLDNTNYPNQSTMALTIQIPLSQLELDGAPGYNPLTDARIELNPNQTVQNGFTGYTAGGAGASTDGFQYQIVPEPGTGALILGGLILAYASKKAQQFQNTTKQYLSKQKHINL